MSTRFLALMAVFLFPAAVRAVDVEMKIDVAGTERTVVIRLDEAIAPKTGANFAKLCAEGFYNGIAFHRVIPNYIVQTGDPLSKDPAVREKWGSGGPGYTIPAELGGSHVRGAIAAARLGDKANPEKASSGSQFYVALRDIKPLDGQYTVFGNVISGLEAFDEIAGAPADDDNVPTEPISILSTRVLEEPAEQEMKKPALPDLTATEATKPAPEPAATKPRPASTSAVAAVETPPSAPPMEKSDATAASALAAVEPAATKPRPASTSAVAAVETPPSAPPMEKSEATAASALAAVEPPKPAPPVAPAPTTPLAPTPVAPMEKPSPPSPLAIGDNAAPALTALDPAMGKQPDNGGLALNATPVAVPSPPPVPPAPSPAPAADLSVADALAAAMKAAPAPEPGAPASARAADVTGFVFSDPVKREPSLSDLSDDRMALNPDRGLPPVRLEADGDTLARATAALGTEGGVRSSSDPNEGFMPLSSVGNLESAPASAAAPKPERRLPDPPNLDREPDPQPFPASRLNPPGERPSEAAFATAPETVGGPNESDPLSRPPFAAPMAGPGEVPAPAVANPPAEPEKPRGIFGKFIRRVW